MYFVDSGVWIGAFNPKDAHHREAKPILKAITDGKLGKALFTDHVFGEVVTYLRRKIGSRQSVGVAKALLDSGHVEVVFVNEDIFSAAYHIFERYPQLSFADATSVVVMQDRGVSEIFSFDRGFDGVQDLRRLETVPTRQF